MLKIINGNFQLLEDLGVTVPQQIISAIAMMEAERFDLDFGSDAGAAASPKRQQNEQGGTPKKRRRGSGATSSIATPFQPARNIINQKNADKMKDEDVDMEDEDEDEDVDMAPPKIGRTRSNSDNAGAAASARARIAPKVAVEEILLNLKNNTTIVIEHTTGKGSLWYVRHEGKDVLVSNIYDRPGTYPGHETELRALLEQIVMRVATGNFGVVKDIVEFCLEKLIHQREHRHAFLLGTSDSTCKICGRERFDSIHSTDRSDTILWKVMNMLTMNINIYNEFQAGLRF